jgi:uncharacterized HhH-GPD family protein
MAPPSHLYFTDSDEANRLLADDPVALLLGFVLDQQVTVQKAFAGPLELRRRLGSLDPGAIAAMEPATLEAVFRTRPALHRFPASMARRTQALCHVVAERYGGDAARIWIDAADGDELAARLAALPGFGPMKVATVLAVLAMRLGVDKPGLGRLLPPSRTLGDVDSPEALAAYQTHKREAKAAARASAG